MCIIVGVVAAQCHQPAKYTFTLQDRSQESFRVVLKSCAKKKISAQNMKNSKSKSAKHLAAIGDGLNKWWFVSSDGCGLACGNNYRSSYF